METCHKDFDGGFDDVNNTNPNIIRRQDTRFLEQLMRSMSPARPVPVAQVVAIETVVSTAPPEGAEARLA